MLLPSTLFSILLFTCYQLFVSCQLDLDTNSNGTNTSLTYLFINSDSSLQLLPNVGLTIENLQTSSITARVSTQSFLSNAPCFTNSNTPPCQSGFIASGGLSLDDATLFLKSVYYENPSPMPDRTVVVMVTVEYQSRESSSSLSLVSFANVLEKRDKPIISFLDGVSYAPVYNHEQRPVAFLDGSKFALSSQGGMFTSLLVCVYTQTGLESLSVDTNEPNTNSPVTTISQDSVCSGLDFNSIDNTTLLQTFSAFSYSEKTAIVSNYNDRVVSVSVDSGTNIGDPLYFNISYAVPPTPISIQTAPVVYYESVGTHDVALNISSVRMSDVINITRQSPEDGKLITSLLLQSNSSHIPMVSLWNDQLCSTHRFSHPVHKFEFCSDEQFFFDLELTSNFVMKFGLTKDTILVEGRQLNIFNATEVESYGFLTFVGSTTQTPDANHFSIWFKNAPGELTGCPLEILNGPLVDYKICLTGSDSLIQFGYSGLAPEHHEVTVSYPTNGAFRLDDWNFVSVSVRRDSISFLLNEIVLAPSEFYWFDDDGNDYSTQIPVHLYSTSFSAITNIYILGKDKGFIGEATGVVVDQFYITTGEAHCMFSCVEGFYVNETIIAALRKQGLKVAFVRESFEVTGNMSLADVDYILENVYYDTPLDSSRAHRAISVTASDDTFSATELTRVSYQCTEGSCFDNTYCYTMDSSAACLCREGYLDASISGDMSLCKHPMDCSHLNGGCSALEQCVQIEEEVRECEDACVSAPCLNNGTCTAVTLTQYNCTCVGEFYGTDCICRNSCLSQDCSPGECIDFCNGSFICIPIPQSSSLFPTPSPIILSASATSYVSSTAAAAVQSTYFFSSISTQIPQFSSVAVYSSSLFIASQTPTAGSSFVDVSPSSVLIPASSVLSQTSTFLQESTQLTSASFVPQSSSPAIAMATSSVQPIHPSSGLASQYSQVVSSVFSSQLTESMTSSDLAALPTSIPMTSQLAPSSSDTVAVTSQAMSSSSVVEVFTSSQIVPSSSVAEGMTSSQVILPSSTVDILMSSQVIVSSSVIDVVTSSQIIPSSSVVEVITSSQIIPSSSVIDVVTSSQIPSSSVIDVVTSSQIIPSSSVLDVVTSSQIIPSSSVIDVVTSSQIIPSSSVIDVVTSSQIPSSSVLDVVTSSQIIPSSSVLDVVTSSQFVVPSSASADVPTSSQVILPSSTIDILMSSQIIVSSSVIDGVTSQIIPSSSVIDVVTSSQIIPSSSVIDVVTSSQIPSSSVVEAVSSSIVSSSVPVIQTPSASDVTYTTSTYVSPISSQSPDSSIPSLQSMVSSGGVSSIIAQPSTVGSSSVQESSYDTRVPLPTTTVVVPSSTSVAPNTTIPRTSSDVAIGIGVALGIFILILVIIAAIALVFALFLFRMNRFQNLDPTKDFDKPDPTSPAQITAVYKNKVT